MDARDLQVAGNHYLSMPIQPAEFIHRNRIGYIEGRVITYLSRWRKKNGIEDLKKARHMLDLLIQFETLPPLSTGKPPVVDSREEEASGE